MLTFWENWEYLIRENTVWTCVSPHSVSSSYTVWTSFVLRSTLRMLHKITQTCKHRQTGSSHCSSFVYTLTFSQHLSYVLYTFGKRGPFSNWGPYCSFCYKSPVWMPKQTRTHTVHMALVGYLIVFSIVTKCGQTIEFLLWGTIVPLLQVPHNLWRARSHPQTWCIHSQCMKCFVFFLHCQSGNKQWMRTPFPYCMHGLDHSITVNGLMAVTSDDTELKL